MKEKEITKEKSLGEEILN